MNHAITIGGLLATIGIIVGLGLIAIGAITTFAGGMSDAPAEGDKAGKLGCSLIIAGIVLTGLCIWSLA